MKNFKKFLEEVTIKGNPGIPGEGHKDDNDKSYLSDVESRAKTRLGIGRFDTPHRHFPRIMELVEQSKRYLRGNEEKLEQLATDIILQNYGDILEGVELDIKFARNGREVANFMEEEDDDSDMPDFRQIKDEELIRKIHKAKIANNIIQGEAKNTKHILHTDAVKDGLMEIYGDDYNTIFNIWDEITKIADKLDWLIPVEVKADMLERAPEGMAGAVKVKWKKNEEEEDKEEDKEDINKKVLDDLEKGDDDNDEEYTESHTPVIMARGIDFPMLLHEAVKGIYELIASISIPSEGANPKDVEDAKTVKLNVSSFGDEAEDFRTGPEIAADFRDFINQNPKAAYSQNMRAYIFGKMMDPSYMTSSEFLSLFRGILNETPEARRKIDSMISEIVEELKKFELGEVLGHDSENVYTEPEDNYPSYKEDDIDDVEINYDELGLNKPNNSKEEEKENYSELSQRELQNLIDNALDAGDFEKVHKISQYLKEGKEIYLNELYKVNKLKNNRRR